MKRWAASEIDLREFEKPGNVLSRVRSVQTPSVLPLSYIHNRLGEFYLRGKRGISLEHGIELMMKFHGLKKLHGRFWKPTLVVSNPGGTPRPFAWISETRFVQGLKGDSNAAAESLAYQQPDGSTKPGARWCKPQKTPEALSCVALEARHLLCVGHLPRFDIMAVLKGSMKFCWLRRTKTVFASRNSYYLSFTLDFLALAIISNLRTVLCSERVVY